MLLSVNFPPPIFWNTGEVVSKRLELIYFHKSYHNVFYPWKNKCKQNVGKCGQNVEKCGQSYIWLLSCFLFLICQSCRQVCGQSYIWLLSCFLFLICQSCRQVCGQSYIWLHIIHKFIESRKVILERRRFIHFQVLKVR